MEAIHVERRSARGEAKVQPQKSNNLYSATKDRWLTYTQASWMHPRQKAAAQNLSKVLATPKHLQTSNLRKYPVVKASRKEQDSHRQTTRDPHLCRWFILWVAFHEVGHCGLQVALLLSVRSKPEVISFAMQHVPIHPAEMYRDNSFSYSVNLLYSNFHGFAHQANTRNI